jgi:hypothetical protein
MSGFEAPFHYSDPEFVATRLALVTAENPPVNVKGDF